MDGRVDCAAISGRSVRRGGNQFLDAIRSGRIVFPRSSPTNIPPRPPGGPGAFALSIPIGWPKNSTCPSARPISRTCHRIAGRMRRYCMMQASSISLRAVIPGARPSCCSVAGTKSRPLLGGTRRRTRYDVVFAGLSAVGVYVRHAAHRWPPCKMRLPFFFKPTSGRIIGLTLSFSSAASWRTRPSARSDDAAGEWAKSYAYPRFRFSTFHDAMTQIRQQIACQYCNLSRRLRPVLGGWLCLGCAATGVFRRDQQRILTAEKMGALPALLNPDLLPNTNRLPMHGITW